MNWYQLVKFASIWDTSSDGSFEDELRSLYELEYKYNMMRQLPFQGMERRRANMLAKLESEIETIVIYLKSVIEPVFSQWLANHAILDPQQWAEARVNGIDEYYFDTDNTEEAFGYFTGELADLTNQQPRGYGTPSFDCSMVVQYLNSNAKEFEPFMNMVRNDRREMEYNDIQGEIFDTEEEREAELEARIARLDEMTIGDWISDFYDSSCSGISEAMNTIATYIPLRNIMVAMYRDILFPMWMNRWGPQGIEDTRKAIEDIYSRLQSIESQSIAEATATINLALNASHQTGEMTDYLQEHEDVGYDIKHVLDDLSAIDEEEVREWMRELKSVGVEIAA